MVANISMVSAQIWAGSTIVCLWNTIFGFLDFISGVYLALWNLYQYSCGSELQELKLEQLYLSDKYQDTLDEH